MRTGPHNDAGLFKLSDLVRGKVQPQLPKLLCAYLASTFMALLGWIVIVHCVISSRSQKLLVRCCPYKNLYMCPRPAANHGPGARVISPPSSVPAPLASSHTTNPPPHCLADLHVKGDQAVHCILRTRCSNCWPTLCHTGPDAVRNSVWRTQDQASPCP